MGALHEGPNVVTCKPREQDRDNPNSRICQANGNVRPWRQKVEGMIPDNFTRREEQQVELIEWILDDKNLKEAIKAVKRNKSAEGVDQMTVEGLDGISESIRKRSKIKSGTRNTSRCR